MPHPGRFRDDLPPAISLPHTTALPPCPLPLPPPDDCPSPNPLPLHAIPRTIFTPLPLHPPHLTCSGRKPPLHRNGCTLRKCEPLQAFVKGILGDVSCLPQVCPAGDVSIPQTPTVQRPYHVPDSPATKPLFQGLATLTSLDVKDER